jgi:histidinol phosphatase-like PHP family hydrolase
VDVLAHPLRLFTWVKRPCPREIHRPLAKMLAQSQTAAEVNFHKNPNDPAFFRECLDQGVKISFGSDTHALHQAGALRVHIEFLRQVAGQQDILPLLYRPV